MARGLAATVAGQASQSRERALVVLCGSMGHVAVVRFRVGAADRDRRDRRARLRADRDAELGPLAAARAAPAAGADEPLPVVVAPRHGAPWVSTVAEVVERSPRRVVVRDSGRPRGGTGA